MWPSTAINRTPEKKRNWVNVNQIQIKSMEIKWNWINFDDCKLLLLATISISTPKQSKWIYENFILCKTNTNENKKFWGCPIRTVTNEGKKWWIDEDWILFTQLSVDLPCRHMKHSKWKLLHQINLKLLVRFLSCIKIERKRDVESRVSGWQER